MDLHQNSCTGGREPKNNWLPSSNHLSSTGIHTIRQLLFLICDYEFKAVRGLIPNAASVAKKPKYLQKNKVGMMTFGVFICRSFATTKFCVWIWVFSQVFRNQLPTCWRCLLLQCVVECMCMCMCMCMWVYMCVNPMIECLSSKSASCPPEWTWVRIHWYCLRWR